jgi:hypothetical protein
MSELADFLDLQTKSGSLRVDADLVVFDSVVEKPFSSAWVNDLLGGKPCPSSKALQPNRWDSSLEVWSMEVVESSVFSGN